MPCLRLTAYTDVSPNRLDRMTAVIWPMDRIPGSNYDVVSVPPPATNVILGMVLVPSTFVKWLVENSMYEEPTIGQQSASIVNWLMSLKVLPVTGSQLL